MTRTNAAGILTVLLRAAAVWMVARVAVALPATVSGLATAGFQEDTLRPVLIGTFTVVLVAAVVWIFADLLARLALARPGQPPFDSDLSLAHWQELAIGVVGLLEAANGLITLCIGLLLVFLVGREDDIAVAVDMEFLIRQGVVEGIVQLVIGVALLFGARGLAALVRRMRDAGPRARPAPVEDSSAAP
jgi:hypothetical protein